MSFISFCKERGEKIKHASFKIHRKTKKNWAFSLTLVLFSVLILLWATNPCGILNTFFGEKPKPAEILSYIGVACGAILLLGNQFTANKRNLIMEKGQLDIRFKDAATLLASENTSAILSGIYALHQIAVETAKDSERNGYISVISDILCAFVRENYPVQKDTNENETLSKCKPPIIVLQTIIDILLFNSEKNIYPPDKLDFSNSKFCEISFSKQGFRANLSEAYLKHINLIRLYLNGANLNKAFLAEATIVKGYMIDVNLELADLRLANLTQARLVHVNLRLADLTEVNLSEASLTKTNLKGADLRGANLIGVKFNKTIIDSSTDFTDTIYQSYSEEQLKEIFIFEED